MSHALVAEVLDHAPPELSPVERLVLIAVAEAAQDSDRPGRPAREAWPSMATLCRRTGSAPTTVRSALQRLARRGMEIRVPVSTDKRGRPVYAFHGRATRYRLPVLHPAAAEGDATSSASPGEGDDASSASSSTTGRRRRVVALTGERRQHSTTKATVSAHEGDDPSSPNQKEPEGTTPPTPRAAATTGVGQLGRRAGR